MQLIFQTVFILIAVSHLYGQETSGYNRLSGTPHYLFPQYGKIGLKDLEVEVLQATKDSIIMQFKPTGFFAESDDFNSDFPKMFHFVHLNNDSLVDIVYQGWSGGEGEVIRFYFQNPEGGFQLKFEGWQYLSELIITNRNIRSFEIYNPGCCAEYVQYLNSFVPEKDTFVLAKTWAWIEGTTEVELFFEEPFEFEVINAPYYLRFKPEIDNVSHTVTNGTGNRVASYDKGDRGVAYGLLKDNTGREWWYVEMKPKLEFDFSVIPLSERTQVFFLGWMSSRYLKKLP